MVHTGWQRWLSRCLNVAMVALLGWTLAYWTWQILSPAPIIATPADEATEQSLLPSIQAAGWFGQSNTPAVVQSASDMKLVGLYSSAKKHRGFAIFKLANGTQATVLLNQEITPGTKLIQISKDHVVIDRQGTRAEILLESKTPALILSNSKG